jgi:hypothetical protein
VPSACDDVDPCTLDRCDPLGGCDHRAACDDGNACTVDLCQAGSGKCETSLVDCDDLDAATIDFCVPFSGCVHLEL